nr:hypothetical protein [Tanacetum cinerariifolium]
MSTQQNIYAAGFESRPPMLNKENYVPWSSRLLWYAKSRPNGKLIYNSIINGPYVRRMIPELGDTNREVPMNETFHVQTDDELTEKELKQIEADDQAIQTILFGLPKDIYTAVDSCETAQEIWLRVQQIMKGSDIGYQEKKAKLFNEWERFTSNYGESIESSYHQWSRHVNIVHQTKDLHTTDYTQLYDFLKYNQKEVDELKAERLTKIQDPLPLMTTSSNPYNFPVLNQYQPSFNQNYMQQLMPNPEDITDPTTAMNMALALMAKAFKLNYSTPTNNNQRISSNPRNRQIAQPGMNMGQDRQMQMVGGNGENQFRQYAGKNVGNLNGYNTVQNVGNQVAQNPRVQNVGNQNGLIGVTGNANQNGNGNLVAAHAEGIAAGHNGNQIRCYNCRGVGHFARNYTVRPKRRDVAYLQTQLLIAQKEVLGIQLQAEEFDLMAQASTSGTQTDKAPVYDSDGSTEVYDYENCNDNEIFNMFTQKEQYTELLKPIPEPHQKAAKFVGDFNSLAKEADESLAKHQALELEIERLLRAVVSQDIMSIVQKASVVDTSNLQSELERTKNALKTVSLKRRMNMLNFGMIGLQAQLGDLKGKSKDTSCVSDTLNPLSQKLENENVELEFRVLNYAKENAHLKTTYNDLFDSISVSRTQTKTIIASLQHKLQNTIYENAKLRAQLFKKVSVQKDNTRSMSKNTKFTKQSILGKPPMLGEIHALSKPVTSKEEKHVPNNVRASTRTKPINVSQPPVFTKKDVNFDSNGLSFTGLDNTKTRRPQPRSNTKNDRVPSASKSSRSKNKGAEVEEHHRNLLLSKNTKHMSSACNNIKLDSHNVISKVVCAMCKQCLISNHDPKVKKTKKVGFIERLATPKPSKPRFLLRSSPTGRLFDQKGIIVDSSESESQSDCSNGDNACSSNTLEPKIKRFLNSTSLLGRNDHVATILGFGDLQWGNILLTRVYFVEGLGHNLFSIGQFCDSDLEVAFRKMLVSNDLVSGLPNFKYHKEHVCPSCEQGKSKRASHPPKPVPNSRQ